MAEPLDPAEPRQAPTSGLQAQRVADADRDRTVLLLREHLVDGRITLDEFSGRIGVALEARTRGDLSAAMADLPEVAAPQVEASRRKARRWFVGFMSSASAKGRWRVSQSTTAIAVMGGCDLDLRSAEIDGPEVVITAIAFWGGVNIVVPEGIDVELEGFSFMGGRTIRIRDVPIVPGSPRIRVRGFAVMGGVDVKSRGPRKGRDLGQKIVDHVMASMETMVSGDPSSAPIDVMALQRDIRAQYRNQRHGSSRHRERNEAASRPAEPVQQPDTEASAVTSTAGEGTVTILFCDMVDYAGMTERLGDQTSRELLRDHHQIVRELLVLHGGREVKVQGDGFMVAFGSVARSLRCAAAMQQAFAAYSVDHPDQPLQVHIGIHTGEVMEEDDDFLGHTVIVASRLADVAAPGEVLVSSLSALLVERTGEFSFKDQREATLKGLAVSQQVTTLAWAD